MAKIVAQAAFTIGGTVAQGLARIAIPILVGNLAGKTTLGTVSFILSVSVLLSMVWPAPAGTAASRYGVDDSEPSRSALRSLRASTLVALAVIAIASFGIVAGQTDDVVTGVLAALVTVTYSAYFFTRGVLLGRFRARRLAAWEIGAAVVAVAGTVASLAAESWVGAVVALAVGYLAIAVANWPIRLGQRTGLDRSVLSFTAQNAVANAASNGMVQLTMVIVFATTSPVAAGVFAAAFSLATPTSLLGQTLNQVLIPHLAEQARDSRPRPAPLARGAALLAFASAVPFALVFWLSPFIVQVLYPDYPEAAPLLRVLIVAMYLFTIALYPAAALTAWGNARSLVVANIAGLIVGVAAMVVLTLGWGAVGAAVGLAAGTAVLAVATTAAAARAVAHTESSSRSTLG